MDELKSGAASLVICAGPKAAYRDYFPRIETWSHRDPCVWLWRCGSRSRD
jgi:hypothetical protein